MHLKACLLATFLCCIAPGSVKALYFAGEPLRTGAQIGVGTFLMFGNPRAIESMVSYVKSGRTWYDWELGLGYLRHERDFSSGYTSNEDDALMLFAFRIGLWSPGPLRIALRVGGHVAWTDFWGLWGLPNPHGGGSGSDLSWPIFEPTLGVRVSKKLAVYGAIFDETTVNRGIRLGLEWKLGSAWTGYMESVVPDKNSESPFSFSGPKPVAPNVGVALHWRLR